MNKVLTILAQSSNDTSAFNLSLEMAHAMPVFRSNPLSVYYFFEWFGIDEEGPIGSFNLNLVMDRMGGRFYFLIGLGDGYSCFEEGERLVDMKIDPVLWLEELAKTKRPFGKINDPRDALHVEIQNYPQEFRKLIDKVREFKTYLSMDLDTLRALQERRAEEDSPF